MSPSPGDEAHQPQETKSTGGLASVFKGLASATKLTKSLPTAAQSSASINAQIAQQINSSIPSAARGLPQQHIDSYEHLKNGSTSERIAAANTLRFVVADYPLNPVLDIWYAAKDLIQPTNPKAARVAGWELLTECVKHTSSTDLDRREYFQTISAPANPDDFHLQLVALADLTKGGRDVSGFDYDVFPLLSTWLEFGFDSVRAARNIAKKQGSRSKGKALATGEDRNFADLFTIVTDVIKFNFLVADDEAAEAMINVLLNICMNTSVEDDMRACIGVMEAIVTYGVFPGDKLKSCVQILGSIHCLVPLLEKEAWHTISILCRSHNGQATVRMLLDVLSHVPTGADKKKEGVRDVRGALSVLTKLVSKSSEKGYPAVSYALLIDGLSKVAQTASTWKIHLDILRLVNSLLGDAQGSINAMLVDEDWTPLFDIAVACVAGVLMLISKADGSITSTLFRDETENPESLIARELMRLIARLEEILREQQSSLIQRQDCIVFFARVHLVLPDTAAILLLNYFKEFRCCSPSDPQWDTNLSLVLTAFFMDKKRITDVRLQALHIITEVYDMVELINEQIEPEFVPGLIRRLLAGVAEETDIVLLQEIAAFTVIVATGASFSVFCHIVDTLHGIVSGDRLRPPITPLCSTTGGTPTSPENPTSSRGQTPSYVVTRAYAQMFLRVMNVDGAKACRLFHSLVAIARSNSSETDARIAAMQLLFRLRADWANRIFVTTHTEITNLATTLFRTEASLSRKSVIDISQPSRFSRSEASSSARTSRGVSFSQGQGQERAYLLRSANSSKTGLGSRSLWSASDPDILPENPSQAASPMLFSGHCGDSSKSEDPSDQETAVLPVAVWLEAILNLLQQGCDWEIYSFILVYLPPQLSNHAIFKDTVAQIQELRRIICDQIRQNSFHEPPSSSGLRRADVAICLFHTLTMILSYHQHFQRAEEDEIVRTFVHGIATWERSAKCCIHALTICCHELPSSTSKALVTILQRMAQIITQPYVAMHILEFLACLSRLPSLYVNFREDEYRIVFGICFRYLQYVRGKKQSYRALSTTSDSSATISGAINPSDNQIHPNASDDLPQYVYTLAYHIILYWFLALKLPDRPNQVGWIAKNLFMDVDGSQVSDEQAQITMDYMQRVTYADIVESAADPLFTADRFGEILTKRWLVGNSIVTIEQAVNTGWAQITKRQPSSTSCYTIRESVRPPPAHQSLSNDSPRDSHSTTNTILPSHLFVQLLSSMPQGSDTGRPIPLPDDEGVDRAIRMFDHNSTVDGYKVGVVYIGENQTSEPEILANVSGSSDYGEFLNGLGTLTKLKGATFNTQGLDREYDTDGQYTFCWRDRVTELVFHVTTQMPTNLDRDPQCIMKKRHIGNDFVNIIFNDSGLPFKFDTFPSEFNYVNIVITPESRASFVATRQRTPKDMKESFYKVQVMSKPGFPEISPASETKIVSLKALPDFTRLLALNASVFALVWADREVGEHISPWRNRLREINRLRDKYGPKFMCHGPTPSPPGTALGHGSLSVATAPMHLEAVRSGNTVRDSFSSLRRSSVATFFTNSSEQNSHRSSLLSTATTDNTEVMTTNGLDSLVESVDFSKWA
ncbi:hypothetical protein F4775DRAFT_530050 [Biscogniauxia sp. FL1348]|nr:hypothetical protein F4775DRAFT_530050 [Biscogniauxia sp. FL1348]